RVQHAVLYSMDEPPAGGDAQTERARMFIVQALETNGKTVTVVHHGLQTDAEYVGRVLLLNRTVCRQGWSAETVTRDNIGKTYRGEMRWLIGEEEKNVVPSYH